MKKEEIKEEIKRQAEVFLKSEKELDYDKYSSDIDGSTIRAIIMRLNYLQHNYKLRLYDHPTVDGESDKVLEELLHRTCSVWPGFLLMEEEL